jgi:hypothetical protein
MMMNEFSLINVTKPNIKGGVKKIRKPFFFFLIGIKYIKQQEEANKEGLGQMAKEGIEAMWGYIYDCLINTVDQHL